MSGRLHTKYGTGHRMPFAIILSIGSYATCSAVMLVANKAAVHYMPMPGFLTMIQNIFTLSCVFVAKSCNFINADDIDLARSKAFVPYAISFVVSLYANVKVLQASNVETVIIFRSLTPLCVSVLEWRYFGRKLPNVRSALSLIGVVLGAIGYAQTEIGVSANDFIASAWSMIYLASIVFSMTEGKRLLGAVSFVAPVWGAVFYTSLISLPGLFFLAFITGELQMVSMIGMSFRGISWVCASCFMGLCISWTGWNCRASTTATTYTLVGVVCKLGAILLNLVVWTEHASPAGLGWLVLCIVASGFYQQAPERDDNSGKQDDVEISIVGAHSRSCPIPPTHISNGQP